MSYCHPTDRRRLEAIVANRSAPQKHVWRAHIILATAEGCGTAEIICAAPANRSPWSGDGRRDSMAEGVDGLTRDKTRKPGKQPLPATVVQRVVDLTLGPPPGDATHWTGRMLAKAAGVSLRSVQRTRSAPTGAASRSHLQAVDRPEVRGEAQGHCWSLRRSARPCGRSVGR